MALAVGIIYQGSQGMSMVVGSRNEGGGYGDGATMGINNNGGGVGDGKGWR